MPEDTSKIKASWPRGWLPGGFDPEAVAEVHLANAQQARVNLDIVMGSVHGTLSGVQDGERAYVTLLPVYQDFDAANPDTFRTLLHCNLGRTGPMGNDPFAFDHIPPGEYLVAAAAMPADAPVTPEAIMAGRIAAANATIAGDQTIDLALAF